jgi:hypothetical protein
MRAAIAYLDGLRIARGLRAGIRQLVADRDYLNRINVFPLADLLGLSPVLRNFPDGRISTGGLLLGRRHSVAKFARFVTRRINLANEQVIGIGHAADEVAADELLALLLDKIPNTRAHFIAELGTAPGAHGGRKTLVVAVQKYRNVVDDRSSNPEPADP